MEQFFILEEIDGLRQFGVVLTSMHASSHSQPPRKALSIAETADTLGVSHWTVRRLIKSGAIRSCRILRTHIIPLSEIDRLLDVTRPKK